MYFGDKWQVLNFSLCSAKVRDSAVTWMTSPATHTVTLCNTSKQQSFSLNTTPGWYSLWSGSNLSLVVFWNGNHAHSYCHSWHQQWMTALSCTFFPNCHSPSGSRAPRGCERIHPSSRCIICAEERWVAEQVRRRQSLRITHDFLLFQLLTAWRWCLPGTIGLDSRLLFASCFLVHVALTVVFSYGCTCDCVVALMQHCVWQIHFKCDKFHVFVIYLFIRAPNSIFIKSRKLACEQSINYIFWLSS